ncbi:MAG TPA: MFS transporter [Acidimicrobiales bacterium]|nr:MFS transporter [Acidimicrobiales bacterium]
MSPAAASDTSGATSPDVLLSRRREFVAVVGILLALLMGALDQFVVLTALPNILAQFGQVNSGSTVVSAYIIASTVAIPLFGKLSDLWSRRNVFLAALLVFIVGSLLAGVSQNLTELIAFRAVQGFGSGGFFPVGIAIVAVSFPPAMRARITGFLLGVFGIATVAGPLIGSTILTYTTWRWVFYVNLPIGIVGGIVLLLSLGPLNPAVKRRFDTVGAGLLVGWVGSLEYALVQIADSGWAWTDPRVVALLGAALVLAAIFCFWELRRAPEPLVPLRLLSNRIVAVSGSTTFLVGTVFFPLATFLSLVVGIALTPAGVSAADAVRNVLYALVLPLVVGAALGGQLLVRISYRLQVSIGVAIAIAGMLVLRETTASTPAWTLAYGFLPVGGIILPLIPLGFGIGLTFPVFLLAVQNEVEPKDVGEASGLVQFLQSLGGSIGLSVLASYVASQLSGRIPTPTLLVSAYDRAFTVMAVVLAIAFAVGLLYRGRFIRAPATTASETKETVTAGGPTLVDGSSRSSP